MSKLHRLTRRGDEGAIAVLYAIVFSFVLVPMMVVATTTLVRVTTSGELQRAADAGSLAGAATIPFGDLGFARSFLDATAGGARTDQTLSALGLGYTGDDPLTVACDRVAMANAMSAHNIGRAPTCHASYLSDLDTLAALRDCADGLAGPIHGLPTVPDLSPLLPALLRPGVEVTMTWRVKGPMDQVLGGSGTNETVTSIAHRRFKNVVVIPEATLPIGNTINLNPLAGDVRTSVLHALDGTERLLSSNPATAGCAGVLDGAHDDIVDAIDPPGGGPAAQTIIDDAVATHSPLLVARVVTVANALGVPYLDFVPVCADRVGSSYVGHLGSFGSCSITAPGAFRASLRRS